MLTTARTGQVVYRLEESITDEELQLSFGKGDILSHETLQKLIAADWYEIKVTIIVLQ